MKECPICRKVFKTPRGLADHKSVKHPGQPPRAAPKSTQKRKGKKKPATQANSSSRAITGTDLLSTVNLEAETTLGHQIFTWSVTPKIADTRLYAESTLYANWKPKRLSIRVSSSAGAMPGGELIIGWTNSYPDSVKVGDIYSWPVHKIMKLNSTATIVIPSAMTRSTYVISDAGVDKIDSHHGSFYVLVSGLISNLKAPSKVSINIFVNYSIEFSQPILPKTSGLIGPGPDQSNVVNNDNLPEHATEYYEVQESSIFGLGVHPIAFPMCIIPYEVETPIGDKFNVAVLGEARRYRGEMAFTPFNITEDNPGSFPWVAGQIFESTKDFSHREGEQWSRIQYFVPQWKAGMGVPFSMWENPWFGFPTVELAKKWIAAGYLGVNGTKTNTTENSINFQIDYSYGLYPTVKVTDLDPSADLSLAEEVSYLKAQINFLTHELAKVQTAALSSAEMGLRPSSVGSSREHSIVHVSGEECGPPT